MRKFTLPKAVGCVIPLAVFMSCICIVSPSLTFAQQNSAEQIQLPLGVRREKPKQKPFVEIDDGYMVPYEVSVPIGRSKIEMIPVPGDEFELDVKSKAGNRTITIRVEPFWMAKTETTWEQYRPFMKMTYYFQEYWDEEVRPVKDEDESLSDAVTVPSAIYDPVFVYGKSGGAPDYPATSMTQFSAQQYTKFLSKVHGDFYRLPSRVEWKYACRGIVQSDAKPSQEKQPAELWHAGNSNKRRHSVASKTPNAFGLFDMQGSVSEWVLDAKGYSNRCWQVGGDSSTVIEWPKNRFGLMALGGSFQDPIEKCKPDSAKVCEEDWFEEDPNFPQSPFWMASDIATGIGFRIMRPLNSPQKSDQGKFWNPKSEDVKEAVADHLEYGRGRTNPISNDFTIRVIKGERQKADKENKRNKQKSRK